VRGCLTPADILLILIDLCEWRQATMQQAFLFACTILCVSSYAFATLLPRRSVTWEVSVQWRLVWQLRVMCKLRKWASCQELDCLCTCASSSCMLPLRPVFGHLMHLTRHLLPLSHIPRLEPLIAKRRCFTALQTPCKMRISESNLSRRRNARRHGD
jgi:hypothetical protein